SRGTSCSRAAGYSSAAPSPSRSRRSSSRARDPHARFLTPAPRSVATMATFRGAVRVMPAPHSWIAVNRCRDVADGGGMAAGQYIRAEARVTDVTSRPVVWRWLRWTRLPLTAGILFLAAVTVVVDVGTAWADVSLGHLGHVPVSPALPLGVVLAIAVGLRRL